jgi:predicted SAM-dependent methyltransferase
VKQALLKRYRKQPEGLRETIRNVRTEFLAARATLGSRRDFRKLKGHRGLRVHLGCGPYIKPGWLNVDLTNHPPKKDHLSPDTYFINHDLRRGLPLDDGSCEMIYSAHFFEHLKYVDALRLMKDCHRILQSGGIFRASLPDFRGIFEAYLRGDQKYMSLINIFEALPDLERGTETLVDHVNYGVYQHGQHKWIMDAEKIMLLLRHIGFASVKESSFQENIDPEVEMRRRYSFYVEAIK